MIRELNDHAALRGQTLAQMHFLGCKGSTDHQCTGRASSLSQIKDNVKSVEQTSFTSEELQKLDRFLQKSICPNLSGLRINTSNH